MIRQLTEQDNEACQALIQTRPAENLFIIGDIEAYGYDQSFQKLWGDFDELGNLRAVLLKYEKNYLPFALGDFDAKGFAEIMSADPEFSMLSGLEHLTGAVEPFITKDRIVKRKLYYAKLTSREHLNLEKMKNVKTLEPDEISRLKELLETIPEFHDKPFNLEKAEYGTRCSSVLLYRRRR